MSSMDVFFEDPTKSVLNLDLDVTSNEAIKDAINSLQEKLRERCEDRDIGIVTQQLAHIEMELGKGAEAAIPLSLEHLELFHGYLGRLDKDSLPEELHVVHERLVTDVEAKLHDHPLASVARSGDRADKAGDAGLSTYFKVPLGRRRQMAVMLHYNFFTGPQLTVLLLFLIWRFVPYMTYIFLLYAGWVTYDNVTRPMPDPRRVSQSWRRSVVYKLFRDYFPIRMVRSGNMDETRKDNLMPFDPQCHYLFCYHPHGVQSSGALAFATAALGFDEMFPGLAVSIQTLGVNFKIPIIREEIIALGVGDASKGSLMRALGGASGSSALLVTGGAKESLLANPYASKVVMKGRTGFVKIALAAGARLVPMYAFGENNLYENLAAHNSSLRKWQRRVQHVISFAPLLVSGRGVFSYGSGLIPRRRPITVVVGEPIDLGAADSNPSNEKIEEAHQRYRNALQRLFDTYKEIYDPKAESLEFV